MKNLVERPAARERAVDEWNSQQRAVERQLRLWRGMAGAVVVLCLLILPPRVGKAQERGPAASLAARVAALEDKLAQQGIIIIDGLEALDGKLAQQGMAISGLEDQLAQQGIVVIDGLEALDARLAELEAQAR